MNVTPNDGYFDGLTKGSAPFTVSFINESNARRAIEIGINNSLVSPTIFTDYPIYVRLRNTSQYFGYFDKVVEDRNQTWAFNYISTGESYTFIPGIGNKLLIWENSSLLNSTIATQVFNFINNTRE